MSFWEEIQKQYQNAEGRYRENLNTGINLMTNKANMMQQMFSNQMQSLGTQANMLGQSLQLPAQFTQMLANIDESARDRAMRESQFNKEYELNRDKFNADTNYQNKNLALQESGQQSQVDYQNKMFDLSKKKADLDEMLAKKEISKMDYDFEQAKIKTQIELYKFYQENPKAKQKAEDIKKMFPNAGYSTVLDYVQQLGLEGGYADPPVPFKQKAKNALNWITSDPISLLIGK